MRPAICANGLPMVAIDSAKSHLIFYAAHIRFLLHLVTNFQVVDFSDLLTLMLNFHMIFSYALSDYQQHLHFINYNQLHEQK